MKETLEQYHIYLGYLLLFLSLIVWGLALWQKEYLKIAPTKWLIFLLGGIAFTTKNPLYVMCKGFFIIGYMERYMENHFEA